MKKIEKSIYTGYLWESHKKEPQLYYEEELEKEFDDHENPFIIEGWLTNGSKSHYIRYVDGQHMIKTFDLDDLRSSIRREEKKYLPSFKGCKKLCFEQFWRPVGDVNCEGMKVLQPAEFVFTGFIK